MVGRVTGDRQHEAAILSMLGPLHAMQGSFEVARHHTTRALAMFEELSLDVALAHTCLEAWRVEMLAGDIQAGERLLRRAYDRLEAIGERYLLSTVSGLLAQTLYELGRFDEAEPLAQLSRELATDVDIETQTLWRCIVGKLLARQGSAREGEALVREAIEMLSSTDAVLFRCYALLDLVEVQRQAGTVDVDPILLEARALADEKGWSVMVAAIDGGLAKVGRRLV
jgi:ATP/maltotriose-dependent transcriptional regulator MalT